MSMEIDEKRKQNSGEPLVSICCLTYNHEAYIRDALEGFLKQKVPFSYEILIYDDASTDGTADIIRAYHKIYPDIIRPILQTENQYSKGITNPSGALIFLGSGGSTRPCARGTITGRIRTSCGGRWSILRFIPAAACAFTAPGSLRWTGPYPTDGCAPTEGTGR